MYSNQLNVSQNSTAEEELGSSYHRARTLYLVRHGEAQHNVLEAQAQEIARKEAAALGLSDEATAALVEKRREAVLLDPALRDAPLTDRGCEHALQCARRLQALIDRDITHAPTEALVSPLSRTLETCRIILDNLEPKIEQAHIRPEIQERQTQYPPDTPLRNESALLQYTKKGDRYVMEHIAEVSGTDVADECRARESREMLRQRASKLFDLLMKMNRRHLLIVSHKGYLRELERGLLGLSEDKSPLFANGELRVYKVIFTRGDRRLNRVDRIF